MYIQTLCFSCSELKEISGLITAIISHATSQCGDAITMP